MNIRIYPNSSAGLPRSAEVRRALSAFLLLAVGPIYAQSALLPSGQADPAAAGVSVASGASGVAPFEFRSVFEGYRPYTEEKTLDWKRANDNVGKIGGWREYAREASQQGSAAAPVDTPAKTNPATDPKTNSKAGSAKP